LSAVTQQLGNVMQDVAVKLYSKATLACVSLGSSAADASKAPPIPDAAMQRQYANALAATSDAVTYCRYALSPQLVDKEDELVNVDKQVLSQSMAKFADGSNLLYTATAAIRQLQR
jgi:hypothetical protein